MRTRLAWRVRDAAEEWLLAQARQAREAEWCRWAIRKRLTPLLGRRFYDEVVAADDEDARMAAL